jgi:hypothetical protein
MILGLSLPAAIDLIPAVDAQIYYQEGFRIATLTVVWIVSAGSIVALFQKVPVLLSQNQQGRDKVGAGGD